MQSVIEYKGNDSEAWHSEEAQNEISYEEAYLNVLPSKSLSPVERIAIYRRMFVLRMTDAMEIDYPGVQYFFGEEKFNEIVLDYIGKFPSSSYTLNHLGRNFPRYLQESGLERKEFLFELATLELALTENMDASQDSILTKEEIAQVVPEEWESAALVPVQALELLTFEYPAAEYLRDVMDGKNPEGNVGKRKNWVVVYRKEYTTWFKQLMQEEFVLLSSLCSGKTLAQSLDALGEHFPEKITELEKYVFEWFSDWVGRGMFSKIIIPKKR